MRLRYYLITILLCLMASPPSIAAAKDQTENNSEHQKYIVAGYIENVSIKIWDRETPITIEAKMDTGADSSSLHATDITIDKNNKTTSFTITDQHGKSQRITCPYARIVRIKKRPSGYQRRPVIPVQLHIGAKEFDALVNLTDRSHFSYKMLVGRKELRHGILIDSSRHHRLSRPEAQ
ncbi:RimK/LysX family protein [Maridesulfovibrio sp.]|uniref:ATP-dependent zinc protease family protein n=1 Tax=Maridesulfovibrio sp. TaxID=2795000 RepID=UPI0029F48289|nr:RimK/LysX family protein [Maridesulfovibrio sp.]